VKIVIASASEAIQKAANEEWIASSLALLAMTKSRGAAPHRPTVYGPPFSNARL
jgi:hypothetical protein